MLRLLFCLMLSWSSLYCEAQPTVLVVNTHHKDLFYHQTHYCAQLFGFDTTVHIMVSFNDQMRQHEDGYTMYRQTPEGSQIYIRIRSNLSRERQQLVLAHEMVHARQFVYHDLQHREDFCYVWKGKVFEDIRSIPYVNRQWEREAFLEADRLYYRYAKQHRKRMRYLQAKETTGLN